MQHSIGGNALSIGRMADSAGGWVGGCHALGGGGLGGGLNVNAVCQAAGYGVYGGGGCELNTGMHGNAWLRLRERE
jgi:hypothetical protein